MIVAPKVRVIIILYNALMPNFFCYHYTAKKVVVLTYDIIAVVILVAVLGDTIRKIRVYLLSDTIGKIN